MLFTSTWRRPLSIKHPQIWKEFERDSKQGNKLKFSIIDLSEDRYEDLFKMVVEQYAQEEPWTMSTGLNKDSRGLEVFKEYLIKHLLPQNMTLICVLNKEECEKRGVKPKIVAFNLLSVRCKSDECDITKYFDTEPLKRFLITAEYLFENSPNVFDKYNTDKILFSIGLCVDKNYRLMGLSTELLKLRHHILKTFNIKATTTIFTALGSQKAAKNSGFVEESSIPYCQIKKAIGINIESNSKETKLMSLTVK